MIKNKIKKRKYWMIIFYKKCKRGLGVVVSMEETKKINPVKNVELYKDCYVFFVDFNAKNLNYTNMLSEFRKSILVVKYINKYSEPIEVPLDVVFKPSLTKYKFEQILIFQKRITGVVKNDILNIYYTREGVLDKMSIHGYSVNEINKVTRYCMRRIYDYILDHYND